jgi:hypothetical protein
MNLIVIHCGIGSATYGRIHRWEWRVAVIKSLTYSIFAAVFQNLDLLVVSSYLTRLK